MKHSGTVLLITVTIALLIVVVLRVFMDPFSDQTMAPNPKPEVSGEVAIATGEALEVELAAESEANTVQAGKLSTEPTTGVIVYQDTGSAAAESEAAQGGSLLAEADKLPTDPITGATIYPNSEGEAASEETNDSKNVNTGCREYGEIGFSACQTIGLFENLVKKSYAFNTPTDMVLSESQTIALVIDTTGRTNFDD